MNELDALARVVLKYLQERDGQTVLTKDLSNDTAIAPNTIRKKVKLLEEKGLIKREGKKYFFIKKEE